MNRSDMLRQLADELDRPAADIKLPSGDITVQEAMRRLRAAWPKRSVNVSLDVWDMSHGTRYAKWEAYVDLPGIGNQDGTTLRDAVEKMERVAAEHNAVEKPFDEQVAGAEEVIAGSTDTAVIPAAAMTRTSADEVGDRLVEAL